VQIALRLRAFGGPENFELTDVPKQAIRPGMALIRVDAALPSRRQACAAAFARFVDHILRHDRVWICRRNG